MSLKDKFAGKKNKESDAKQPLRQREELSEDDLDKVTGGVKLTYENIYGDPAKKNDGNA